MSSDIDMSNRKIKKSGFTLIEMMVTMLIAGIVMLGLANVIADAHRGYGKMYTRIHGNIVNDAYIARLRFDKICRKAVGGIAALGPDAESLTVVYYSVPNTTEDPDLPPDMYAEFYLSNTDLLLATGAIGPNTVPTTETVAGNVTELQFSVPDSRSVQMVMTLADPNHSITITCGSIRHN